MSTTFPESSLPEGWDWVQLRRVATIQNGADYKSVEVADGGYPVYGSGGAFRLASDYLYDGESVLFGRKGTIDKPLHVTGRFWTVDTMFYTTLSDRIVGRYLFYCATTIPYAYYSTSTALPSMTQGDLAGHKIPLPPRDEQRAIADFLDEQTSRIDTLIGNQVELIEFVNGERQSFPQRSNLGLQPNQRRSGDCSPLAPHTVCLCLSTSMRELALPLSGSVIF